MRSRVLASILAFLVAGVMLGAQTGNRVTKIGTCAVLSGSGTPQGVVTGKVCDMYLRTDGASGTVIYVKASGTGNTGWETAGTGGGGTGGTGASPEVVTRKAADQSVTSSTTLVNDLHLTFNVAASETWVVKFVLFVDAGTTGDLKVGLSVPAAATYRIGPAAMPSTAGTVSNPASSTTTVSVGGLGAATVYAYTFYATVVNSTTAGAVTLQFAQDVSDGTATTLKTNSFMVADPVGSASAAATAGSMILLETHTASSSATLDFTSSISSTYDDYLITFENVVPATTGRDLYYRVSTDGGASYDSTALYAQSTFAWVHSGTGSAGEAPGSPTTQFALRRNTEISNDANYGASGSIQLHTPAGAYTRIEAVLGQVNVTPSQGGAITVGSYQSTTAVNAIRFYFDSGNISKGTIRIYGLAKSAQLAPQAIQTGAHASRPTSSLDGRVYLPTDGFTVARDSSSTWVPWGPLYPLTAPPTGSWSWVNQGTSTITESKDALQMLAVGTSNGTGSNIVARVKTAPSTPYTITAYILPPPTSKLYLGYGLVFRQNGAGTGQNRILAFWWAYANAVATTQTTLRIEKWTNATTFSASYAEFLTVLPPHWFRIQDDGANVIFSSSADGVTWVQLHSVGRLDFLLQGADQVGFMAYTQNAATPNLDVPVTVLSWKEGS